jgi:hypothetical protein
MTFAPLFALLSRLRPGALFIGIGIDVDASALKFLKCLRSQAFPDASSCLL